MNQTLTIEVQGIGFPNKGAELMLLAICDKIQRRYPDTRICLQPNQPFSYRKNYPVYQIGKVVRFGVDLGRLLYLIPKKLRDMFGIVMPREVNVILDASGFAYGDQWGTHKVGVKFARKIKKFKQEKKNRKVILLPQAFGPFTNQELRKHMQDIIDHADLIFARDETSFTYLKDIEPVETISQKPDFTNRLQTLSREFDYIKEHPVCFIPNSKMLEMKSSSQPDIFIQFMAKLVKSAYEAGHTPYLLIHEGEGDAALANKIKALVGIDLLTVQPSNAEQVKQAIGASRLVVSSRFHGLVSALSQNIPVIATGWSHKYQALLNDYGVADCIFDESRDLEKAKEKMLLLLDSKQEYDTVTKMISERSEAEKLKTDAMWQQVYGVIDELNG